MKYLSSWMLFESRNPNDIRKFNKKEKLTVYHRTEDEIVSKVGRDGFRSGGGNAWGDGIYACYDLISTTKKKSLQRRPRQSKYIWSSNHRK